MQWKVKYKYMILIICQFAMPATPIILVAAIDTALKDSNPFVRRAGVTACAKLHYHSPELALASVVDPLYSQIRDPDPAVVTFAMQTVNRILEEEGGIVMPDSMAKSENNGPSPSFRVILTPFPSPQVPGEATWRFPEL